MFKTAITFLTAFLPNWLIAIILVIIAVIAVILVFKLVAFILDVLPFV